MTALSSSATAPRLNFIMRLNDTNMAQPESTGFLGLAYLGYYPQVLIPVVPTNRKRYYVRGGRGYIR